MPPRPRHALTSRTASAVGFPEGGQGVTVLRWLAILGSLLMIATAVHGEAASKKRTAATSTDGLKPPIQGLLDRHHEPKAGYTKGVRNFVIDTSWASLQPERGGPIVHPNDIDRAISYARQHDMGLKLRVGAGIYAPQWAKNVGGDPVPFYYTAATSKRAGELAGTVGHFWDPAYGAAYEDLQSKLAALYDDVPEIRGVVVTRCQTIFAETYLRNTKDERSTKALLRAGFTRAADDRCHDEQVAAHKVWQQTRSEVAFNPYQAIQADGSVKQDEDYTLSQMDSCRATLGPRCILANYSISAGRAGAPGYGEVYGHMAKLGAPIAFQTATAAKIGDWQATLGWAVRMGAGSVELPTGYDEWPAAVLGVIADRLAANAVGSGDGPGSGSSGSRDSGAGGVSGAIGGKGGGGKSGAVTTGAGKGGSDRNLSAGLKPPVRGLLDRHQDPKRGYTDDVRNFVVDTSWASLQPQHGGPIARPNDIDRAIALARGQGMGLKLRVGAGIHAPQWAKQIGGDPVPFHYTASTRARSGNLAGTVGHFWNPAYGEAYEDLHNKLAALYDDVPEVQTVVVTRCQTIFAETYLRNTRDPRSAAGLLKAGFTRAADDVCHNEQIAAHRVWQRTRSEVAFNAYQAIKSDGSRELDIAYTESQMGYCRTTLGPRCVLANYSISERRSAANGYGKIYDHMAALGAPIAFQTATHAKVGDWQATLEWAVRMGASSVELPSGYHGWPAPALGRYAERLVANPVT